MSLLTTTIAPTERAAATLRPFDVVPSATQAADRLLRQALFQPSAVAIMDALAAILVQAGVPLARAMVGYELIHPLIEGQGVIWRRGKTVEVETWRHDRVDTGSWERSPFYKMEVEGLLSLRLDPTDPAVVAAFPVFRDFGDLGLTDYLALRIGFDGTDDPAQQSGIVVSLSADRDGFQPEHLVLIEQLRTPMAIAFKLANERHLAETVMETYHGRDAGQRILSGRIRRGDGEWLRTVIWMSDLRNSTGLADQLPVDRYLSVVNAYADCTAGAVLAAGGDVLEIIGDAVLGIFPVRGSNSDTDAAQRALTAALDARARLARLREKAECVYTRDIEFGIGIHWGELVYGNVGTPARLNFGLIGPAVNEASRLESLTKQLKRPILVSGAVAALIPREWEALGPQDLRGVGRPIQVFAPA
ncbi:MAG: adenylate/guanylate cyclase domain-containing protein [Alphaproteobacteria bacterium]|nr:adenylate/guanylate cyclase domain-containing protein [Alphaproteobacteria bacterium]